jgi:hypothetical protein
MTKSLMEGNSLKKMRDADPKSYDKRTKDMKETVAKSKRGTSDGYMPRQSNVDAARKLKGDKGFAKVVKGGYNNPGIKALRKDLGKDIAKAKQRTAQ